uniref:Uncharacterized protein n=1 Tax=Anopheles coluzzii TaxID=1518534 RepID=A0A8W7P545_ANOCL
LEANVIDGRKTHLPAAFNPNQPTFLCLCVCFTVYVLPEERQTAKQDAALQLHGRVGHPAGDTGQQFTGEGNHYGHLQLPRHVARAGNAERGRPGQAGRTAPLHRPDGRAGTGRTGPQADGGSGKEPRTVHHNAASVPEGQHQHDARDREGKQGGAVRAAPGSERCAAAEGGPGRSHHRQDASQLVPAVPAGKRHRPDDLDLEAAARHDAEVGRHARHAGGDQRHRGEYARRAAQDGGEDSPVAQAAAEVQPAGLHRQGAGHVRAGAVPGERAVRAVAAVVLNQFGSSGGRERERERERKQIQIPKTLSGTWGIPEFLPRMIVTAKRTLIR